MVTRSIAPWAEIVPGLDRPMTADELFALPDDEWQYELVDGRLGSAQPAATLGMGDSLDGEEILPGFALPLTELFA